MKATLITLLSYLRQPKKRPLIQEAYKLKGKTGLEIGGPSHYLFGLKSAFPVYVFCKNLDCVTYSGETFWEGSAEPGRTFEYLKGKKGLQYVSEGADLSAIKENSYEFLLASHCLEHMANPIKALREWQRVLKPGGILVLILPDKNNTFDSKRPYTTYAHLLEDFSKDMPEDDATHLTEIRQLTDYTRTDITQEEHLKLLGNNYQHRMAHHHVFNEDVTDKILRVSGYEVISHYYYEPFNQITVAKKAMPYSEVSQIAPG